MPELFHLLIYILVLVVIAALVWWVLSQVPLPEPFAQIVRVVVVVIFCLILIGILLQLAGFGGLSLHG